MVYLIGSLRNDQIPVIANRLRQAGNDVFSSWFAAGKIADDSWRDYEKGQGYTFKQALKRPAAVNVFQFDKRWLERADTVVLALPAGRSGFLEFGWAVGQGKKGYILLDNPDRWDVMLQFSTEVFENVDELLYQLELDRTEFKAA